LLFSSHFNMVVRVVKSLGARTRGKQDTSQPRKNVHPRFPIDQVRTLASRGVPEICTTSKNREKGQENRNRRIKACKILSSWFVRKNRAGGCTKSGHSLVERLHSIENARFADAGF
jgi:hypothetical protein